MRIKVRHCISQQVERSRSARWGHVVRQEVHEVFMMANVMVGIAGNVNFFVVVVVDVVINVDVVKIVITHLARLARVEGIAVVVVVQLKQFFRNVCLILKI